MKELSGLADLLKVILYDILGLLIPGLLLFALLLLLAGYCHDSKQPFELINHAGNANKIIMYGMLLAAYALGYLLQSISAFHSTLFDDLGALLLHKPELETPALPSGTSSSTRFVERFYGKTQFYQFAREVIAKEIGLTDPKELRFADVSSLALSFAGEEADLARQFRFRADFCGAISTMSLLGALGITPVLVLNGSYQWRWSFLPALLLLWIIALGVRPQRFLTPRLFSLAAAVLLGGLTLLAHCTRQGSYIVWIIPAAVLTWFFMLWRHYLYLQLGGTVHFTMAVAAIAQREQIQSETNRSDAKP
jgi:hypothetical protein